MEIIKISGHRYYQYETIIETYPSLKYNNRKSEFIKKHQIPTTSYIHARLKKDTWTKSNGKSYRYDKLFVRMSWFDKTFDLDEIIPLMPPIIELDESEMFFDDDGNEVDILVVGERTCNSCFFYLKDISKNFQLKNAYDLITKIDSNFVEITDYKFFIVDNTIINRGACNKKSQLFVTYAGLLKLLFTSRKGNYVTFLMWIIETIFTAHLGTKEDKIKLASDIIGASPLAIKEVFNTFANSLPCVYLFQIGTVKSLRKTMEIEEKHNDTDIVVKWGFTTDLARRTQEHNGKKSYGGIKGSNISLLTHILIHKMFQKQKRQ